VRPGHRTILCAVGPFRFVPAPARGERNLPSGRLVDWVTSAFNALVFPFDGFMIGIRGSKQGSVGRSELIKVASSRTYTAR